ncbi:helix-turn-helix domain-containing protein [Deinococcus sp.]|uniref:helix-turn-helix domain-containing protein n=1 Tax=Deinococcus sp. TaxID=47478 RepID=UPI003B59FEFF
MTKHPPSVDALEWLTTLTPDTPEMQAIDREESALIGLARTLRLARERAGLTQRELAQRLGVSQAQISKWENVNANHTMHSILNYLGALASRPGQTAKLIMAVRATDGSYLPVTPLAGLAVVLEETIHQELSKRAERRGDKAS